MSKSGDDAKAIPLKREEPIPYDEPRQQTPFIITGGEATRPEKIEPGTYAGEILPAPAKPL